MPPGGIHAIELILLLLLLFVVVFAVLAQKLKTPYPIVLVIAGLLISLIPGIPSIRLNPEVIFLVVLPPLLYSAAWLTSWREFKFNLVSICMLAFGLVSFTVFGVAGAAHYFFSGFDWRLGFVLGAVVATTDAIAATSIAKRVGLPKRIVDVLEGESLLNDATGLLALQFGVAMVVSRVTPTVGQGFRELTYLTFAGLGLGLLVGLAIQWLERRVDDGPIEITISILVPYAVYLAAEAIHASGVLAVVACGLYLSRKSSEFFSARVRIQAWAVWDSLSFILNGLVFMVIGLQLPHVLAGLTGYKLHELIFYGAAFSALLIVLRLIWMYPGAFIAYQIRKHFLHQKVSLPAARQIFVVGWTGMRGVVALAAAISLPETLADGQPFPQRDMIIFLTFSVILVTLVLQGLTLPPLIRVLGLAGATAPDLEELEARRIIVQAALARLASLREKDSADFADVYDDINNHYRHQLVALKDEEKDNEEDAAHRAHHARFVELSRDLLGVERATAVRLRDNGHINDDALRQIQQELDLNETRLSLNS
jgi:CPA1 family monovalent cation:H+ antiporter